jgi:hypothetical protein
MLASLIGALAAPASAREHARHGGPGSMPLRVVLRDHGASIANCVFATSEVPQNAANAPARDQFTRGETIWGRCFLPDKPGASRPGDLVDSVTIDGKLAWEQAYDHALPATAESRSVPYGEILRTLFTRLTPGLHHVKITGRLHRAGKQVPLYQGDFRYVR